MNTLNHIAIILDGNGRWAKAQGKPRTFGHVAGAKNVEKICRAAFNNGISYLTLYAFSTENWKRSKTEVEALMSLLYDYLKNCIKLSDDNNMRVRVIGDRTGLSESIQNRICELEKHSEDHTGLNLTIALNYGGRDEIVRAVKKIIDIEDLEHLNLTEEKFASYLDTHDLPDPDLLIRTGGEERLSNYLLWQLCYSEFVFTDCYWPDFDEAELLKCIEIYNNRNRRFGNAK